MKKWQILLGITAISLAGTAGGILAMGKQVKDFLLPVSEASSIGWSVSRDALKILNNTKNDVKYFYTNKGNNGQNRWYLHNVGASKSTWDWTWINDTTRDHIELSTKTPDGKYLFVTNVLRGIYSAHTEESMFWTIADKDVNPEFNQIIWHYYYGNVTNRDAFNFHSSIQFNLSDTGALQIIWEGVNILG